VAHNLFKLMAIKDEYEVARLYAETDFVQKLGERFEGGYTLQFHLAPPLLARPDPKTGRVKKMAFGPWMLTAFKWLAKARRFRGSRWDVFGRSEERRLERALLTDYEADLIALLPKLERTTLGDAIALAMLPEKIRGFGHVKRRSMDAAAPEREALRARLGLG
jgi:indolepyruvate ferredoxin oxidoreductase